MCGESPGQRLELPSVCFFSHRASYPSIRGIASTISSKQPFPASSVGKLPLLRHFTPKVVTNILLGLNIRFTFFCRIWSIKLNIEYFSPPCTMIQKRRNWPDHLVRTIILLDLNRSTGPGQNQPQRFVFLCLQEFSTRVDVPMFRSPSLRGVLAS